MKGFRKIQINGDVKINDVGVLGHKLNLLLHLLRA